MRFEANEGQVDEAIRFVARGPGYNLLLASDKAVISLSRTQRSSSKWAPGAAGANRQGSESTINRTVSMEVVGRNPNAKVKGLAPLEAKSNYLMGSDPAKWTKGVTNYKKVAYQQVYPGIDLVFYGKGSQLEYDFVVSPSAHPNDISFSLTGADKLRLNRRGDLVIETAAGDIVQRRPIIYQLKGGKRHLVKGGYRLEGRDQVRFWTAPYDRTRTLTIDPILEYGSYIGGSKGDSAGNVTADSQGNAYLTGATDSLDFRQDSDPPDPYDDHLADSQDAYILKIRTGASGAASVAYATYIGGAGSEQARGIAVDSDSNAYITGNTNSSDFPTHPGNVFMREPPKSLVQKSGGEAFVTKLNENGSGLVYSSYLGGGEGGERANGIWVDEAGSAFVTGQTNSPLFPVTPNAFQPTFGGGGSTTPVTDDAFVTKFKPDGTGPLMYSTYLGSVGSAAESGTGIVAQSGLIFVSGHTDSPAFPVTLNAAQPMYGVGGPGTGCTNSSCVVGGAITRDAFVTILNPAASGRESMVYSTFFGGSGLEYSYGIAVGCANNVFIAGSTKSPDLPKPAAGYALQGTLAGPGDAFLAEIDPAISGPAGLIYSTYLGGGALEETRGIGLDSVEDVYIAGFTSSGSTAPLPTKEAFQATSGGGSDAFLAKVDTSVTGPSSLKYSTLYGRGGTDLGLGLAVDPSGGAYVAGQTDSADLDAPRAARGSYAGAQDGFIAKFTAPLSAKVPTVRSIDPTAGPTSGGTKVTIRGRTFAGENAVYFGDSPASFTRDSCGKIIATSPPHAPGKVHIRVSSPQGISPQTPATEFTYEEEEAGGPPPPPGEPGAGEAPAISGLNPDNGPMRGGTRITVSGANFEGTRAVFFDGLKDVRLPCEGSTGTGEAPCFQYESPSQISVFSPASPDPRKVHVRVETGAGISSPGDADLFEYVPEAARPPAPPEEQGRTTSAGLSTKPAGALGGSTGPPPGLPGGSPAVLSSSVQAPGPVTAPATSPDASVTANLAQPAQGAPVSAQAQPLPVAAEVPGGVALPAIPGVPARGSVAAPEAAGRIQMVGYSENGTDLGLGISIMTLGMLAACSMIYRPRASNVPCEPCSAVASSSKVSIGISG